MYLPDEYFLLLMGITARAVELAENAGRQRDDAIQIAAKAQHMAREFKQLFLEAQQAAIDAVANVEKILRDR